MKKSIGSLATALCLLLLADCGKAMTPEAPATVNSTETIEISSTVTHDTKYGAAIVSLTPEEFESVGFQLGDSVDVEFGNGYTMTDIPYYNGYYVNYSAPVVVAYPGFNDVRVTYNNRGIWEDAALSENDSVTIRLNETGKNIAVQEALGHGYSVDREDYDSDEQFCNFRPVSCGSLKEGLLYRGASPVNNSRNRAPYTDRFLKEYGIAFILDLADTEEEMQACIAKETFNSPYAADLYSKGQMALLDMDGTYQLDEYRQKFIRGLRVMMDSNGPVYVHCTEGKDRTGFACFLLEALAGATYDEMLADYMKTYENYYSVTADGTPERYEAIAELYFNAFVFFLHGNDHAEELRSIDYTGDAVEYLLTGSMSEAEVEQLCRFLTDEK